MPKKPYKYSYFVYEGDKVSMILYGNDERMKYEPTIYYDIKDVASWPEQLLTYDEAVAKARTKATYELTLDPKARANPFTPMMQSKESTRRTDSFVVSFEFLALSGKINESDVKLRIEDLLESMQTGKDYPIIGVTEIDVKKTSGILGEPDPKLKPTPFPQQV